jgi:4-carboxymuconolactone decarboxylase
MHRVNQAFDRMECSMKLFTATTFATLLFAAEVGADQAQPRPDPKPSNDVLEATPQLYRYTTELLFGEVWKRAELIPRDRSLITLSALVASGQIPQLSGHIRLGLDNGLKPSEISALITHLAFYSGWPNAMSAAGIAKQVFSERNVPAEQVSPPADAPLTLDPDSEAKRRAAVDAGVGGVAPELARYTNDVLFGDLWRQSTLSARDRSLVTVAALIAQGQAAQLPFHLNRAMDNGLSQAQAAEVVTHLAFYVGWPKAMSAVPVLKDVFAARQ